MFGCIIVSQGEEVVYRSALLVGIDVDLITFGRRLTFARSSSMVRSISGVDYLVNDLRDAEVLLSMDVGVLESILRHHNRRLGLSILKILEPTHIYMQMHVWTDN